MDSDSSCTYKDFAMDYRSTADYESWIVKWITNCRLNNVLSVDKIPVLLQEASNFSPVQNADDSFVEQIKSISFLQMDEMLVEPLFCISSSVKSKLLLCTDMASDSLLLSLSSYGYKYIVFSLSNCLLCSSDTTRAVYVPQRLIKKIISDCMAKNVDCESSSDSKDLVYYQVSDSSGAITKNQKTFENCKSRKVRESLSPIFTDGFNEYIPIKATLCISLKSQRVKETHAGSKDVVVHRNKRQIQVHMLDINL